MKSEFKKELEFVQIILDNPDKMQEIIETSEFYNQEEFDMCGYSYNELVDYFKLSHKNKIDVITRVGIAIHKRNKIDNCKIVDIRENHEQLSPTFVFKEINGKVVLLNICFVSH